MSKYTTGEIAKLCGVTVRTVQYYDSRNILVPSALSEGGRRLYSEADLKRMKIICFLRELDLPISAISQLLNEEHPENVIDLLLQQQEHLLKQEVDQRQLKLNKLETLRKELRSVQNFSIESIGDIAYLMEHKKKLRKVRTVMLSFGILMELIEVGIIVLAVKTGIWWPIIPGAIAVLGGTAGLVLYYYRNVKYICPQCHEIFRPGFREMFFANHTPNTRKLTCPHCGRKSFCVEVYGGETS